MFCTKQFPYSSVINMGILWGIRVSICLLVHVSDRVEMNNLIWHSPHRPTSKCFLCFFLVWGFLSIQHCLRSTDHWQFKHERDIFYFNIFTYFKEEMPRTAKIKEKCGRSREPQTQVEHCQEATGRAGVGWKRKSCGRWLHLPVSPGTRSSQKCLLPFSTLLGTLTFFYFWNP